MKTIFYSVLLMLTFHFSWAAGLSEIDQKLYQTLETRDIEQAKKLISQGANVNAAEGTEPMIRRAYINWAAEKTEEQMAKSFLANMPEAERKKYSEIIEKQMQARKPAQPYTEFLLKSGAKPNLADYNNNTVLHFLCQSFPKSQEQIRHLLRNGGDPNLKNKEGETALHMAVKSGDRELIQMLLEFKANLSIANQKGINPVDLAILEFHTPLVDFMKSKGGNLSKPVDDLYKMRGYEKNKLEMYKVVFVEPGGRPGHEGIFTAESAPKAGSTALVKVSIFGEPKDAILSLVDLNHTPISSEVRLIAQSQRSHNFEQIYQVKVPTKPFKLWTVAHNLDGATAINKIENPITPTK